MKHETVFKTGRSKDTYMTSIREVAKIAGVSPATVSRVMNGTAKVDEEKRRRVLEAIRQTGFMPNELARALYQKSSKIIGVIVPDIENPFFSELAKAVEEQTYHAGYKMLLCNSDDDPKKEMMNIQMLVQMRAEGIIITTNCDSTSRVLKDCQLPVVVVDRKLTGVSGTAFIEANHYKGGCLAAEHLIKCGCKNIVCLRGPQAYSSGKQRYQGYLDTCRKYGIKEQCVDCTYDYEAGRRAAKEILRKFPKADGIIACNDMVAISVYKVLTGVGRRIPEEIQLIGFDDIRFSSLCTPEITTVSQPIREMGFMAAGIIIRHVEGGEFQQENIFDVKLVERDTTRKKSHQAL